MASTLEPWGFNLQCLPAFHLKLVYMYFRNLCTICYFTHCLQLVHKYVERKKPEFVNVDEERLQGE